MSLFENRPNTRAFFSGIILAAIAVLCITGVLLAEHDTKPAIEHNRASREQAIMEKLLPNLKNEAQGAMTYQCKLVSHPLIGTNMKAYIASDSTGKILGYIGTYATNRGYSNPLVLIAGLDTSGHLTKVDIAFTRETPGIGDKVERKRGTYLDQFDGLGLYDANWDVKKFNGDFDYFTGATVTSRAVVLATRDFLEVMMGTDLTTLPNCPN